jgi:hypothetical protein
MTNLEEEIKEYLESKRKEHAETIHRVNMKHSLKKAGIMHNPNLSTEKLEELCQKLLGSSSN